MNRKAVVKVKSGMYAGQTVDFSDGPVSGIFGFTSFGKMLGDCRPVVPDFLSRLTNDYPDFVDRDRIANDIPNLVYVHVGGLGHIFHTEELDGDESEVRL